LLGGCADEYNDETVFGCELAYIYGFYEEDAKEESPREAAEASALVSPLPPLPGNWSLRTFPGCLDGYEAEAYCELSAC